MQESAAAAANPQPWLTAEKLPVPESIRRKNSEVEEQFVNHFVFNLQSLRDAVKLDNSSLSRLARIIKLNSDSFVSLRDLKVSPDQSIPEGTEAFYRIMNAKNLEVLVERHTSASEASCTIRKYLENMITTIEYQTAFFPPELADGVYDTNGVNSIIISPSDIVVSFGIASMNHL
jgi:hypothetical protein